MEVMRRLGRNLKIKVVKWVVVSGGVFES